MRSNRRQMGETTRGTNPKEGGNQMKKILLVATTLALACGLMLGTGSVLAAQGGQQNQIQNEDCRGLFGTVDEIVLNSDNVPVTIKLTNVKPIDSTADGTADITVTENT